MNQKKYDNKKYFLLKTAFAVTRTVRQKMKNFDGSRKFDDSKMA